MNRLGFFAASIGASLAIAALALSSPLMDRGEGMEIIPIASIDTEHIAFDAEVLVVSFGLSEIDEPALAFVSTPVEPVPLPPRPGSRE